MQPTNRSQTNPPTMQYSWEEWIFTIYEHHFHPLEHSHYLPYLRPYEATQLCAFEVSVPGGDLQITVDTSMVHMRYLSNDEFRREQKARLSAYAQLSLPELGRHDARMCVYGYPGQIFELKDFLRLPHGLVYHSLEQNLQASQDYWRAFTQELIVLEGLMQLCGPTIVPDADENELKQRRILSHFWYDLRRYVRLLQWTSCDVAIPARHANAPNAFLIFLRDHLDVFYFYRAGATVEDNQKVLEQHNVLINEYLYYEEHANKAWITQAIAQGGDAEKYANQIWTAAKERGDQCHPCKDLSHQWLFSVR